MLFNSELFLFVFLPAVFLGFLALGRVGGTGSLKLWWLIGASLVFYASWHPPLLLLLLGSVFGNYAWARIMERWPGRPSFAVGVAANLGLLGYFKYAGFLLETAEALSLISPIDVDILLPLGISFFTFQQIAFLCDVHAGKVRSIRFRDYALFICFFPQLIAGPIVHHSQVIDQFKRIADGVPISPRGIAAGLTMLAIGLFKKSVIAASLSDIADPLFLQADLREAIGFWDGWTAALAFGLQIYFDFSAYSDMAIGIGLMFGVVLPINFFSPYRATSIIAFWQRWHMTLSQFLRDYLYIPLGGNRRGPARRYLNLMIVMILGGAWHGAGWTFFLWGAIHGGALAVAHGFRSLTRSNIADSRTGNAVGWFLTMVVVFAAWVPFRAENLDTSLFIWKGMAGLTDLGRSPDGDTVRTLVLAAAVCLLLPPLAALFQGELSDDDKPATGTPAPFLQSLLTWKPSTAWALTSAGLGVAGVLQLWHAGAFIYFQF